VAYITDATLKEAVAKRQGTTVAELYTTSPHLEVIVADANEQAYQTILTVLLGQGYEKSTIDSWDRREEFNRRLGVCFVYRESALLDEGKLQGLVDHLCKCEEELAAIQITVNGELISPDGGNPVCSDGARSNSDDVFSTDMEL